MLGLTINFRLVQSPCCWLKLYFNTHYMDKEGEFVIRIDGVIKGYHNFQIKPFIHEMLNCISEVGNYHDQHAVLVKRANNM